MLILAVGIVLASKGYPESFETGKIIQNYLSTKDYIVYHAGTKTENNHLVNAGGRVFTVVAEGNTLHEAKNNALQGTENIQMKINTTVKILDLNF